MVRPNSNSRSGRLSADFLYPSCALRSAKSPQCEIEALLTVAGRRISFVIESKRMVSIARSQTACTALALVSTITIFVGCNRPSVHPDRSVVSGSINYNGQPLTAGIVMFSAENDPKLYGISIIRPDGTYYVNDAPIGNARVSIDTRPARQGGPGSFIKIPLKYAKPRTSDLRYTVEKDGNSGANFDLQ
jgi:hypothetical protein